MGELKGGEALRLCFISILQSVLSSPLLISDMINVAPARRKNMRRTISRMRVQTIGNRTDIMARAAVRGPFQTTNVMCNKSKEGVLEAVKRDLLAWRLI